MIELENIFLAWGEHKRGKSGKAEVMIFERHLEDNIFALAGELSSGAYRHGPYESFHIFDPKHRLIHKAAVRDRLVHHLVYKELYRIFDSAFIYHSYASRLDKGTHLAVANLAVACRRLSRNYTRPIYALKCDIRKFFASVPHQKLLAIIQNKIKDNRLAGLTRQIVDSFSSGAINFSEGKGGGLESRIFWQKGIAHRQCDIADIRECLFKRIGSVYKTPA